MTQIKGTKYYLINWEYKPADTKDNEVTKTFPVDIEKDRMPVLIFL